MYFVFFKWLYFSIDDNETDFFFFCNKRLDGVLLDYLDEDWILARTK